MDLRSKKHALRARMRAVRAAVPAGERGERAERAAERALARIAGAAAVLLFDAFGSEIDTGPLRLRLHAAGARVLLPVLVEGAIEASDVAPDEPLLASGYGPREPGVRRLADPAEIDVAIVPGLAFDRDGRRLGYGGGHFDRFLPRLGPGALRVGYAFAEQVVGRVPSGPHDARMDVVVTDAETIECPGRGRD